VEDDFRAAEQMLGQLGYPYAVACVRADYAAWLAAVDRAGEARPLTMAAEATFRSLGAMPALNRMAGLLSLLPDEVKV
jgi:hypothetical protein